MYFNNVDWRQYYNPKETSAGSQWEPQRATKADGWGQMNVLQIVPCAVAPLSPLPKTGPRTELFPSTVVLILESYGDF